MKTISIHSDLPCAVILIDNMLLCHGKIAYFMNHDEAVYYAMLLSKGSFDYLAVVFFCKDSTTKVSYYRNGELIESFKPEIRYERD